MKCKRPGCRAEARKGHYRPAEYCSHACRMRALRDRANFSGPQEELVYRSQRVLHAYERYQETRTVTAFVNMQLRMAELADSALITSATPELTAPSATTHDDQPGVRIGAPAGLGVAGDD